MEKHTFVICAYKKSPYLRKCIESLKKQTIRSNIIIITSTPNEYIRQIAEEYDIPLKVNCGDKGIVQDWNFGYAQCTTPYITIAHQDDIYFPTYAERALGLLEESYKPLIYFSDYCEIRNGKLIKSNLLLNTKRLMLLPLRIKGFRKSKFVRRRILSLGDAISCPSVTFAALNLPNPVFNVHFRSCEDWEAWEKISRIDGEFLYDPVVGMGHRIHEESETSIIINDNARKREDYEMFCKFWPKVIAKILVRIYSTSEKSNKV